MVGRGYWYKAIALPSVYSLLSNSVRLAFLLILLLRHPEKLSKSPKDMKLMYGEGKTWASDPKVSNLVTPSTQARWPWGLAALSSSVKCAPPPQMWALSPVAVHAFHPLRLKKASQGDWCGSRWGPGHRSPCLGPCPPSLPCTEDCPALPWYPCSF